MSLAWVPILSNRDTNVCMFDEGSLGRRLMPPILDSYPIPYLASNLLRHMRVGPGILCFVRIPNTTWGALCATSTATSRRKYSLLSWNDSKRQLKGYSARSWPGLVQVFQGRCRLPLSLGSWIDTSHCGWILKMP